MASISIKNIYDDISSTNKALVDNKKTEKINTNGSNVHAIDRCPLCNKVQLGTGGNNDNNGSGTTVSKDIYAANVITDPNRRFVSDELLERINEALDLYMREDIYDTNSNSIVDLSERAFEADSVDWDNVKNKPNINIGGLEEAVKDMHRHTNKLALDMLNYDPSQNNAPLWNGKEWPYPTNVSNNIDLDIPSIRNIIIDHNTPTNSKPGDIWIKYNRGNDTIESINVKNEDGGWFNLSIDSISNNITNTILTKVNEIINRSFVTDHNDLNNIMGGDSNSGEYYHLTEDEHSILQRIETDYLNGDFDQLFSKLEYTELIKIIEDYNNDKIGKQFTDQEYTDIKSIIRDYLLGKFDKEFTDSQYTSIIKMLDDYLNNRFVCKFTDLEKEQINNLVKDYLNSSISQSFTNQEFQLIREYIENYLNFNQNQPLTTTFKNNFFNSVKNYINTIIKKELTDYEYEDLKSILNNYLNDKFDHNFTNEEIVNIRSIIVDYLNHKFDKEFTDEQRTKLIEIITNYVNNTLDKQFTDNEVNNIKSIITDYLNHKFDKEFSTNEYNNLIAIINKYVNGELNKEFTTDEHTTLKELITKYLNQELGKQFTNEQIKNINDIINDYLDDKLVNPSGKHISEEDYPILLDLLQKFKDDAICTCEKIEIKDYDSGGAGDTFDPDTSVDLDGGFAGTIDYELELDGRFAKWDSNSTIIIPGTGDNPPSVSEPQFNETQTETLLKMINKYDKYEYLYDQFNRSEYQTLLDMIDDYLNETIASLSDEQLYYLQQSLAAILIQALVEELKNMQISIQQFSEPDYNTLLAIIADYRDNKLVNNINASESTVLKQIIVDYNSGKLSNDSNWLVKSEIEKLIDQKISAIPPTANIDQTTLTALKSEILTEVDKKIAAIKPPEPEGHYLSDSEYQLFTKMLKDYQDGKLGCKCESKPPVEDDDSEDFIDSGFASDMFETIYDGGNAGTIDFDKDIDGSDAKNDNSKDDDTPEEPSETDKFIDSGFSSDMYETIYDGGNAGTTDFTDDIDSSDAKNDNNTEEPSVTVYNYDGGNASSSDSNYELVLDASSSNITNTDQYDGGLASTLNLL